jgi:phage tail-like protein
LSSNPLDESAGQEYEREGAPSEPAAVVASRPAPEVRSGGNGAPVELPVKLPTDPVAASPVQVDHVPEVSHMFVGEILSLHTRVRVNRDLASMQVRVQVPEGCDVKNTLGPKSATLAGLEVGVEERTLRWDVEGPLKRGEVTEFVTELQGPKARDTHRVAGSGPAADSTILVSEARVTAVVDSGGPAAASVADWAVVEVRSKGGYLRYLPAVYERDDFMGRFLMLFESFWGPINRQVGDIWDYFDPDLMPMAMLYWLAARLDIAIQQDWPEAVQRRVVKSAVALYRVRGTRAGLERLLETYSGGQVEIVERSANNFRLGMGARLGQGVALGSLNQPHTFSVKVQFEANTGSDPVVEEPARALREQRIRAIIDAEKPAHVTYTLEVVEGQIAGSAATQSPTSASTRASKS